ncbi:MAG TPA: TadE/TadG family type IV pilus assembly protein [Actinomycetota bacterium]|jgi:Flp pilus assembly protein TadG|nr:TadE/TadG family type IV pilus assembly protein [Actinomycetota bacterium]
MSCIRSRHTGSATVELALVLPLALFAALALVQVGLLAKESLAVANAAREGAREAAVSSDEDRVRDAVLRSGLSSERTVVSVQRRGGVGVPVTVSVRYRSQVVVPFVEWLFPEEVALQSTVTMRQETD